MAHIKQTNSGLWVPQTTHEKVDSQKMFVENMRQHESNYTDLINRIHAKVDSISELKALDVTSNSIVVGTVVLVNGFGLYYYTTLNMSETPDDEEFVAPNAGVGLWVLAGGGGNIVVDKEDYGEDTDADQGGLILKIKKLFNKKTKTNFFPVTTTKAVRDTATGKSLFQLLNLMPIVDDGEEAGGADIRDADTLGGHSSDEYALKSDYNGIICVLLADGWVQEGNIYTQTITMPSLTGNEFFSIDLYDDGTTTQEQIDAFGEYITRIDVNAGEIIVQASNQPTVTFSIILRGMCKIDNTIIANLSDIMSKYDDSGWVACTLSGSVSVRNSDNRFTPKIRKFGSMVSIQGQIRNISGTGGYGAIPVLTIPDGFVPANQVRKYVYDAENGYSYEIYNTDNILYVKTSSSDNSRDIVIDTIWFIN